MPGWPSCTCDEQVVQPGENGPADQPVDECPTQPDDTADRADSIASVNLAKQGRLTGRAFKGHDSPGDNENTESPNQRTSDGEGPDVEFHVAASLSSIHNRVYVVVFLRIIPVHVPHWLQVIQRDPVLGLPFGPDVRRDSELFEILAANCMRNAGFNKRHPWLWMLHVHVFQLAIEVQVWQTRCFRSIKLALREKSCVYHRARGFLLQSVKNQHPRMLFDEHVVQHFDLVVAHPHATQRFVLADRG